jgi:hypothetical protein
MTLVVLAGLGVGFLAAGWLFGGFQGAAHPTGPGEPASPARPKHEVHIRRPTDPPAVKTGLTDPHGRSVTVACAVCHAGRPANPDLRTAADLDEFHQGLKFSHGNLACAACHHPEHGYGKLRLADGRALEYADVMQLCAQCHGPQYRDYQHGAHGGMTGHWDLTRGGRQRLNCIDCHDPHAPRYPKLTPAPGPNDRFLRPQKEAGHP